MAGINSNLDDALMHTSDIQTQAGKISAAATVTEAANTTVTVNGDCIAVYREGISAFLNYETQANEKAAYIEKFGGRLNILDHL